MAEINDQTGDKAQAAESDSHQTAGVNQDGDPRSNAGDTQEVPEAASTVVELPPAPVAQVETKATPTESAAKKPYSAFSTGQKWAIVAMVGLASLFS